MYSLLQKLRIAYQPKIPKILQHLVELTPKYSEELDVKQDVKDQLPHLNQTAVVRFGINPDEKGGCGPLTFGVVLSGGQAPGGHNVISGLFDALKTFHPDSRLIGFLGGPSGLTDNQYCEITEEKLKSYRNQGGFDLIGSGRTKIEKKEQFEQVAKTAQEHQLDGLVVIGGDDSNTNAAFLAEYFLSREIKTSVIGVPKTIDGDLKNVYIEVSFGFDTASKIYSEIISNIAKDAISAKKYYYFIKLMGRSASHITLECALQIQPNLALISEEVQAKEQTLQQVVQQIADVVVKRSELGKDYGVILIPEGIIEFIPECEQLIRELNALLNIENKQSLEALHQTEEKIKFIKERLTASSARCLDSIPSDIQKQLLLDRDPHGNVQVSKIDTERLFIEMVADELNKRKSQGTYRGKFAAQPHFCGYEGRSGMPSNFDAQYCYTLGLTAALLGKFKLTGYLSFVQKLYQTVDSWVPGGVPLTSLLHYEDRMGKRKTVIQKALVQLDGPVFEAFADKRDNWVEEDHYRLCGPIQFFGPPELTEMASLTLEYETNRDFKDAARHQYDLLS